MIEPAMTPSRWRISLGTQCFFRNPHRIAALALYGQTFGFTTEDVALLRTLASEATFNGLNDPEDEYTKDAVKLTALADKIAALLPPEGT